MKGTCFYRISYELFVVVLTGKPHATNFNLTQFSGNFHF